MAWLLTAAAASAVAITGQVRFDGVDGFGTSEQTALDSGIPILDDIALMQATGLLIDTNFQQSSVVTGPPARATSTWSLTNNVGVGTVYLVFAKPLENEISVAGNLETVDYDPADVGLVLRNDPDDSQPDWFILQVPSDPLDPQSDPVYYPAVALGPLGLGEVEAFQLRYVLDNPQLFLDFNGFELGIPKWQILAAFVPIPEPATALLVVAGLGALAAGRRRRR